MPEPTKRKFKFTGTESKNFGRHELVKTGQVIEVTEKESEGLVDHPEFEEVIDKKPKVEAPK